MESGEGRAVEYTPKREAEGGTHRQTKARNPHRGRPRALLHKGKAVTDVSKKKGGGAVKKKGVLKKKVGGAKKGCCGG